MAPKILLFIGLMLTVTACKHGRNGGSKAVVNPSFEVPTDLPVGENNLINNQGSLTEIGMDPRIPIELDLPDVPMAQLWKNGAKSLTVHQSLPFTACGQDATEQMACQRDSSYHYERVTKKLQSTHCDCGQIKNNETVLTASQITKIDQLVDRLKLIHGPNGACAEDGLALELIIKSSENVEQSFPVVTGNCGGMQQTRVENESFQALFSVLKNILP